MTPPSSIFWKTITLPPLSPTESSYPYLSKAIEESKSYLVMLAGSGSPKLLIFAQLIGLISVLVTEEISPPFAPIILQAL